MSFITADEQAELTEHLTDARENHRLDPTVLPATYWGRKRLHDELHHYKYTTGTPTIPDYIASHVRMWS